MNVIIEEVINERGHWFYVYKEETIGDGSLRCFSFNPAVIEGQIWSRSKSLNEAKEYALNLKNVKETRQIIEII